MEGLVDRGFENPNEETEQLSSIRVLERVLLSIGIAESFTQDVVPIARDQVEQVQRSRVVSWPVEPANQDRTCVA